MARVVYCAPFCHLGLTVSTLTVGGSLPFRPLSVGNVFVKGIRTVFFFAKVHGELCINVVFEVGVVTGVAVFDFAKPEKE